MNNLWLFHDFTIFNMLLRRTLRTINLSGSDDLGIEACELQSLCEYFSSFRLSVSITISFYLFLLSIFSLSLSLPHTLASYLPSTHTHTRLKSAESFRMAYKLKILRSIHNNSLYSIPSGAALNRRTRTLYDFSFVRDR